MKIVDLLEQLAINLPNSQTTKELIDKQPHELKKIINEGNSKQLKRLVSKNKYFADPKTIFQI